MTDIVQDEIIEEFSVFDDMLDKYQYVVDLADTLPLIDPSHRTDDYAIPGCQSKVWVDACYTDGRIRFTADSNAIITKGLVALLIRVMDGLTPDEILSKEIYFIEKIGLGSQLTEMRSNGLRSMIEQMRRYALAFKTKEK